MIEVISTIALAVAFFQIQLSFLYVAVFVIDIRGGEEEDWSCCEMYVNLSGSW